MEATSATSNGGCVTSTRLRPITVSATAARNSKTPSSMLQQKEIHTKILDDAVTMYIKAMNTANKHVHPNAFREKQETFGNPLWMIRHTIYYHYK
jgi:hypothetical protein